MDMEQFKKSIQEENKNASLWVETYFEITELPLIIIFLDPIVDSFYFTPKFTRAIVDLILIDKVL